MRRRSSKIILSTVAITGVLGASVAVAADPPTCPFGNTPKATQQAPARTGDQDRQQLRKRDGTGPRHAERATPTASSTSPSPQRWAAPPSPEHCWVRGRRPGSRRVRSVTDCRTVVFVTLRVAGATVAGVTV